MTPGSAWLFDLGADIYAWFTAQAVWRASCATMATRLDGLVPGGPILDLGCGPGVSTFELTRHLPKACVVGLDLAPRMLAEARRRRRDTGLRRARLSWLLADARRLPVASGSVAACTGHSFLYLVGDRRAVLAEIRRVLAPGGRLVLMEPHAETATLSRVLALGRDPRHLISVALWRPFSRIHGRFTRASLVQTLETAGFVDVQASRTLGGLGLLVSASAPSSPS